MPSEEFSQFETLTVSSSVVTLTAATYGTMNRAFITCGAANIRFTVNGTTPTTTVGHILYDSDELKLTSAREIINFQAIRDDSTDASLACSYGGRVSS